MIASHYVRGLCGSKTVTPVALVDTDPNCNSRRLYDVPFYTDYRKAAAELDPKIALVTVPAPARIPIVKDLLKRGISVMTEKPMAQDVETVEELFAFADSCGSALRCIFHWQKADEVIYLKSHVGEYGKIKSVRTLIYDDYACTPDGSVREDRRGLLGAWIDSGINILSYYNEILDLSHAEFIGAKSVTDGVSGEEKLSEKSFMFGNVRADITVDWTTPSRQKSSEIVCEKAVIFVDHSAQKVSVDGKTVFERPTDDRLSCHYENLFCDIGFNEVDTDRKEAVTLHKLLFM